MSKAKIFNVENKLAKLARLPGGRTFDEAVRTAKSRVETLRERSLASLVAKSADLGRAAQTARDKGEADLGEVYRISNAIYGLAGAFDRQGLAQAACSLCDVVERFRLGEPLNWPAIEVHVDGIRLLAQTGEAAAEPILAGLGRVRARFGVEG